MFRLAVCSCSLLASRSSVEILALGHLFLKTYKTICVRGKVPRDQTASEFLLPLVSAWGIASVNCGS